MGCKNRTADIMSRVVIWREGGVLSYRNCGVETYHRSWVVSVRLSVQVGTGGRTHLRRWKMGEHNQVSNINRQA